MTRVVIIGSGGREHAIAAALKNEAEVIVTPGNAGIPTRTSLPADQLWADLFIIGPEEPLVAGLAGVLRAEGKLVFGPGEDGATLEGSKAWMKLLLDEAKVPTAAWRVFSDAEDASEYLETAIAPFVIKTDGLASGHGVLVTESREAAIDDARKKLSGESFGDAGRMIVVEENLIGPELSVTAVCNGVTAVLLPAARDHKRLFDGDQGPNTGGMGAFSPVPDAIPAAHQLEIVERILEALRCRGVNYRGILYVGLVLTEDGPKVLECNVRFGDPEAQVILPRITGGLLDCLMAAAAGEPMKPPTISEEAAVTVALASEGYPDKPVVGYPIHGIGRAERSGGQVFHGGTSKPIRLDASLTTAGGRVLYVTGMGATIEEARAQAYKAADPIKWVGQQYRSDIASI